MAESETSSSVEIIEGKEKRGSPFAIFKDFKLPLNFPPLKRETEEVESRGEASETKATPNVVRVPVPDARRDFPSLKLETEEEEQGGARNMWQEMEAIFKYSGDLAPASVSNRSLFVEAISKIRAKSEGKGKRKILLQKTCFGRLIYDTPNDIQFSGNMVHHLLLREVACPHVDEVWVLIGGQLLKFGLYEFQFVTGLEIGEGDLHKASKKLCTISTKLFNSKRRISKGEIKLAYENLETDDDALFVKMSLIYLLELGLLGKDKKTLVDYRHLQLVDNLKKFNKYPWGRVCCEITVDSLKKALHRWQDAGKPIGSMSYSVLGFPYAFQVWAYECIPRLGQQFAVKRSVHREGNPLIFNWSSRLIPSFEILDRVLRETSVVFGLNVRRSHWVAIELDLKDHIVRVYNSMSTFFARWETELQFLTCGIDAVLGPIGKASPNGVWNVEHPNLPQQTGGGDSGMFTMMYLEYLCYGKDPKMLTQEKISEFRRKKAVDFFQLGEMELAKCMLLEVS